MEITNLKTMRNCLLCGKKFDAYQRKDAKFCLDSCRWRYHYLKRTGQDQRIQKEREMGLQRTKEDDEDQRIWMVG